MLGLVLKAHQVDDVDEPHLQVGQVLAQQVDGRERLQSGNIARRRNDDVGILAERLVAGPLPDPQAARAVRNRLVHGEKVRVRLLTCDDDVDILARPQAMVVGGKQRVGVRRQVDAHDGRALVDHVVDEAGILVAEAVVVLTPDMAGQQVIQARQRDAATGCRW